MYAEGTFLWYWFDKWLIILGFLFALALTVLVIRDSMRRETGTARWIALMVVATIVTIPALVARGGVDMGKATTFVTYLDLVGAVLALATSIAYLIGRPPRLEEMPLEALPDYTAVEAGTQAGATRAATVARGPETGETVAQPAGTAETRVAPEAAPAWLVMRKGPEAGNTLQLKPGDTTLGRSSDNDHIFDDATVSRHHARISAEEGGFVLYDLGSTSGTAVDGKRISRQVLGSGNVIALGETELVFMHGAAEPAAAATVAAPAGPAETVILEEKPAVTAWVVIKSGPGAGKTLQLKAGDNSIGRSPDNAHVLEDSAISRQHALIQWREGKFVLYDLGSTSGTKVDGKAVLGRTLASGEVISLGQTQLTFMRVETEKGAPVVVEAGAPGETVMLEEKPSVTAWLVIKAGPGAGKTLPVKAGDNIIGRDPENDVSLEDAAVSRRHALLRLQEGKFVLYDLGSRAGTKVGAESLGGRPLDSGNVITMGQTQLTFMQVETGK